MKGLFDIDPEERFPLDNDEVRVLGIVQTHRGKNAAIKGEEIARILGLDVRYVRDIIKRLVEDHHYRIGALPDCGYFMIQTAREAIEVCENLKHRAMSILKRMSVLKKVHLKELLGQLSLEIENEQEFSN